MQKRTVDLSQKKRILESSQLDVEAAINAAERSLDKLSKRMDPNDKARQDKLKQDRDALDLLRSSQKQLKGEIRSKYAALEIDNLCRRVTPAKADSAKRQSAMQRTGSAPTLRGTKKMGSSGFDKSVNFGDGTDAQSTMAGSTCAPSSS